MERARQAREKLDRDARAMAVVEQQRAAETERQRREAEIARQREEEARQRAVVPQLAAPAAQESRAAQPAPAQTVRQICSGRGNIVSEQLCRTRECRKPAFAADPICVTLKQLEDSNARRGEQ